MRKITTIAMIAAAAVAAPAMAQSTSVAGTVDVTGSVAGKCSVPSAISGTITLNELAIANGTVNSTFSNQTGGLSRSFTVHCTSANVSITVSSDALNNSTDSTTGNGYTGQVHYTSTLTANKAAGGTATAAYTTAVSLPSPTTSLLGGRIANAADNLTVTVSNGHTANAADMLKAGSYSSTITITVAPVAA